MRILAPVRLKAQTGAIANPVGKMMRQHSTLVARSLSDLNAEAARTDGEAPGATSSVAWDFSSIAVFPATRIARLIPMQPKLIIGAANDPSEQEADSVADQVMRRPLPGISVSLAPRRISRQCTACEDEELQRKIAKTVETASGDAPNNVREVLQSPGQPLDPTSRVFFETGFGRDFSRVRVHTDEKAAQSARAINARAYTSGPNVVFGSGQYSPRSDDGRRLLAHELAHVVQQTTARPSPSLVQMQPEKKPKEPPKKKPPARRDIVLLGEGWQGGRELGAVLAGGGRVIQVTSVADAAQALGKIDVPIGTLYFVTHSTSDGSLKFGKDEGFTKAADIANKLKGSVPADKAPLTVDFRGCSVGSSPKAMEDIRTALGAQSVVGGNCYAVINLTTPIKMGPEGDVTEITDSMQVTKKNRKKFEELYQGTLDKFMGGMGSKRSCIVTKSEKDFFAAGGRFVALWFNSSFSAEWIKDKSVCYKDATRQIVDPAKPAAAIQGCSVITVNAPDSKTTEKK